MRGQRELTLRVEQVALLVLSGERNSDTDAIQVIDQVRHFEAETRIQDSNHRRLSLRAIDDGDIIRSDSLHN